MKTVLVMVAAALLPAALALAQDVPKAPAPEVPKVDVKKVDPVVVTATKTETPQERIGGTVTVITEDEIKTYNYATVEEALRRVPGVEIQRSGNIGKTTSLRIRGAGPQQVQVLVDGMRVKSPTLGSAELSEIALDQIERIEIVRGPQSTLHGADAIGGVVNIITKKGEGPPRGSVEVLGGSYRTHEERAGLSGAVDRLNFSLGVSRFESNGQFRNDESERRAASGRIGSTFPWDGEVTLSARYTKLDLQLPIATGFPQVFDPNRDSHTETWLYNLNYAQKIADWWKASVRFGQWWNDNNFFDYPPPGTTTTLSEIGTRRREVEFLNTFELGKIDTLVVGAEHRRESGENISRGGRVPTRFDEAIDVLSYYAQNELRMFDRLFFGTGVRWELNDAFGDQFTPRLSAAFLIPETGTKLRTAWGKGFRAPTINDLFFPGFGNPALTPEFSESYEVGVDEKLWENRVRFGATYAHNHFRDLIQIVLIGGGLSQPKNVGAARTDTLELYLEVEPLDWLLVYVNWTYNDTEDLTTGLPLRRFGRYRWNAGAVVTPFERLSFFVQLYSTTSQFEGTGIPDNPGYRRFDTGATYRIWGRAGVMERLEATLRIENLTDEEYTEVRGFPALGFNALAGVRAYFQ